MSDEDPYVRIGDYRIARIAAGLAMFGAVVLIVLVDAISPDYEANIGVLGLLGGLGITLLGIEARSLVGK